MRVVLLHEMCFVARAHGLRGAAISLSVLYMFANPDLAC